ncbi:hypothetical protein [uncultured Litoreibacter sp.]|uniref:hypothetical protein n=1 Tax=uncultured Litoreibacter sp. TaxID=1392394 RepID=UPI002629746D|nr:hypothetical protein [uncultured Litoreibacter sp.]
MSARSMAGAFGDMLKHLDGIAVSDTLNLAPKAYDPTSESTDQFAYLSDDAIPKKLGKAVVIGVIDDAMPFAHQRLTLKGKTARVASIWMQGAATDPSPPGGVGSDLPFGRELRGAQISNLLGKLNTSELPDEDSLYRATGAIDFGRGSIQSGAFSANHGSGVVDLAAGFAPDDKDARNFPVMAVSLPPEVTRDTLGTFSPIYIIMGVLHLVHRTRRLCRWLEKKQKLAEGSVKLPLVINLSYGLSAGPKDGSGAIEAFMDAVSAQTGTDIGPVTFVLPMGNQRLNQLHGVLDPGTDATLGWQLQPDDPTPSFVEFWGPHLDAQPKDPMQLVVDLPNAPRPERTDFESHGSYQVLQIDGQEVGRAYLQWHPSDAGGRELITLVVPPTVPQEVGAPYISAGTWQVSVDTADRGLVHTYVQRDDAVRGFGGGGRQSNLHDDAYRVYDETGRKILHDPTGTVTGVQRTGSVNAFANGGLQIRVGGCYDSADQPPAPYSSLGRPDQGRPLEGDKVAPSDRSPELPGMVCMGSLSGSRQALDGTSVACPQVTREIAMLLSKGKLPVTSPKDLRDAYLNL